MVGMELEHDFFHASKLSKDQKKGLHCKLKRFVVKTKKGPNIIQGSDVDHSQIIGGHAIKLFIGVDISSHPPRVLAPLVVE